MVPAPIIRTADVIRISVLTLAMTSLVEGLKKLEILPEDGGTLLIMAFILMIIAIKVW